MSTPKRTELDNRFSRRGFLGSAIVGATPAIAPAADPPGPTPSPVARAQADAIIREHGAALSEAQKGDVRRLVAELGKTGNELRSVPLDNADEPALIFRAPVSDRR